MAQIDIITLCIFSFFIAAIIIIGKLDSLVLTKFTLHTEPRVNPPEFTVTCQTQGGPAQQVDWEYNKTSVTHRQSKVILSTSHNSVYDNNLHVRGRLSGLYKCFISNSISTSVGSETVTGGY